MHGTQDLAPDRLLRLAEALGAIMGAHGVTERTTIGELGLDSAHLVDVMIACEDLYGTTIDFSAIDIDYDMSIAALHAQLVRAVRPG